ncbi:MAG: hypothetical protein IJB75_03380 [Oscillospiraceae bacterium]|nr:hypothetical protein [Oscillospiraceae bacterium]
MRFTEILNRKTKDNQGTRSPFIAFLGDSVTQGVFEVYEKNNQMKCVFDSMYGYPEKLRELLAMLWPNAPVSIFNAGVDGSGAPKGWERFQRDVLPLKPDLLIVCFGLNDVHYLNEGLAKYKEALHNIFSAAKQADIEVIFMTPNMMNTHSEYVGEGPILAPHGPMFAERQLNGEFDAYIDAARQVCREENVILCDCYAIWKNMYEKGVDTSALLCNGLNHPTRKMHELFAWQLVHTILNN